MAISGLSFKERSLLFAKLSQAVYLDELETRFESTYGFNDIKFYNSNGAQAYRFMNKDDIVIACRGTEPTEFNDIKADLKAILVVAETIGRVHRGFKKEVDDIWPQIKKDIQRLRKSNRKIWFTGHSLGAAMATIMASRCHDDNDMMECSSLYTYGSPRVGNSTYINSVDFPHHRWVNNNDIVTRVPPWLLFYRHHGEEHYMNAYGNVRNPTGYQRFKDRIRGLIMGLKEFKIDSFSDHSMSEYVKNLEKFKDEAL